MRTVFLVGALICASPTVADDTLPTSPIGQRAAAHLAYSKVPDEPSPSWLNVGASTTRTLGLPRTASFSYRYFGGDIIYERSIMSPPLDFTSTGARLFAQYPIGRLTPRLSYAMNTSLRTYGSWGAVTSKTIVGFGLNLSVNRNTDLFITAEAANSIKVPLFGHGLRQSYNIGVRITF